MWQPMGGCSQQRWVLLQLPQAHTETFDGANAMCWWEWGELRQRNTGGQQGLKMLSPTRQPGGKEGPHALDPT